MREILERFPVFIHSAEELGEDDARCSPHILRVAEDGVEDFLHLRCIEEHLCLRSIESAVDVFLPLCAGEGRKGGLNCFDLFGREQEFGDVGFREIAVVLGLLFLPQDACAPLVIVPADGDVSRERGAGFLPQMLQPLRLVGEGALEGLEGIEVFDLAPGIELFRSSLAEGDTGIEPHHAFEHVRLRCVHSDEDAAELLGEGDGFRRGADVRLRHDFHEGGAGAIEIAERFGANMREFSGVVFHVEAVNTTMPLTLPSPRHVIFHEAISCEWEVVLGDLKAHREIWVEVVLAVEVARGGDRTSERQCRAHGLRNCFAVGDGERSRVSHADFTYRSIWFFIPGIVVASAEHFRPCVHLRMDLQADDGFKIWHASAVDSQ